MVLPPGAAILQMPQFQMECHFFPLVTVVSTGHHCHPTMCHHRYFRSHKLPKRRANKLRKVEDPSLAGWVREWGNPWDTCLVHSGLQSFTLATVSVSPPACVQRGSVECQPPCESRVPAGLTVASCSQKGPESSAQRLLGLTGSCVRQSQQARVSPKRPLICQQVNYCELDVLLSLPPGLGPAPICIL